MRKNLMLVALVAVALVALLLAVQRLPSRVGTLDFRAYWSTSYLLSRRLDYTDQANLLQIETSLTGWAESYALKLWNLPWVVVWFLPLSLLNFNLARLVWLVANLALLNASIAVYWRAYATKAATHKRFWLALLIGILFPATLLVLLFGQVGMLVLAGLVGLIVLYRSSHDLSAGACLALTMVKPHLVYLVIPLLILVTYKARRWRVWLGFALVLLVSIFVGLWFRPSLISDYFAQTAQANLLAWQNPTLSAYIHTKTGLVGARLIGLIVLPITILLWARSGQEMEIGDLVNIVLLLSIITSPFGWSYDFVLLLLPLVRIALWVAEAASSRLELGVISIAIVLLYVVIYLQRTASQNELDFFWIPIAISGFYLWARHWAGQSLSVTRRG